MTTDTKNEEYILYILMRNDLVSLTSGKAMAQASHASNAFIKEYGHMKDVKAWAAETDQGFGTVIVLTASKQQILDIVLTDTIGDTIYDPTYPYVVNAEIAGLINEKNHTADPIYKSDGSVVLHRSELTCAYVFGEKQHMKRIVGHLPLHP